MHLKADCERCFGLCCVAPAFSASADFAHDKAAGDACAHLQRSFTCGIHERLRERGYPGCTVYDCFGAGQQVAQVTFHGRDWRQAPETAEEMFRVFRIMRQLHEWLWYLTEALTFRAATPLHDELRLTLEEIEALTQNPPSILLRLDMDTRHQVMKNLLQRASELMRAGIPNHLDRHGADLIGASLRGADLRGADLRGAYLVGANLRGADLRRADVIGADFRATDLRGADLSTSLFLTQSQVTAAMGDTYTKLPSSFDRPPHWSPS